MRVFKLASTIPQFRSLIQKMGASVKSVSSMLLALLILVFFLATTMMHLFADVYDEMYGGRCLTTGFDAGVQLEGNASMTGLHSPACTLKPRHHFDNIAISYLTVFQVMTTDNWLNVMWDTYLASGKLSLFFFPLIIVVGNYITMNIFLAILLSTFSAASKAEAVAANLAAEKEAEAVADAAKAAAAVTANAELMMRGSRHKRRGGRSPGSPTSPGNGETSGDESPSPSRSRRISLRAGSRSTSPVRKRGAISLSSVSGGLGMTNSAEAAHSAMAAAAAAALGPDATLRATKVFRAHDIDKSGAIDVDEMKFAMRELGLDTASDHLDEIMLRYDVDESKALELPEFLALVRDTPAAPPTMLGRFFYGLLPVGVRQSDFIKKWVAAAAKRAAAADQVKAGQRARKERIMRKNRRSHMRARTSRFGSLNAWEVAYFAGVFDTADIDGDGFLVLDEVYSLLFTLNEEPTSNTTWDVLDANAARDDLISKDEFLTFISIKRTDDATIAARGGLRPSALNDAMKTEANNARRDRVRNRLRRRNRSFAVLLRRIARLRKHGKRVYLDRLPPLGEFAREGLGEERGRFLQRIIYSTSFWYIEVILIVASALLVSTDIDVMVRQMRLGGGVESLSSDAITPRWVVAAFDASFMFVTMSEVLIKLLTEGVPQTVSNPWNALDIGCLTFSLLRLLLSEWRRTLLSFASLRVFMLLPRFKELKLLFESILRALPNVIITMVSLMVIWLMFAILGVSLFGGGMSQCARLNETEGIPGCGGAEDPISCRYARFPLPPPASITPGVSNSSRCGCEWIDGVNTCRPFRVGFINETVGGVVAAAVTAVNSSASAMMTNATNATSASSEVSVTFDAGEELAWVPAYPNFDTTGYALLSLMQISTLDGWSYMLYFSMDMAGVDLQPARENQYFLPMAYYLFFVIFGVLFATNVFVGVVIDEFKRIRRLYDGSATLTEEQIKWVNTQRLILRLAPEKTVTFEPGADKPRRQWCFRLVHDDDKMGRPTNAPAGVKYRGKNFERVVRLMIVSNVILLMLWADPIDPVVLVIYESVNYLFVVLLTIEAGIKITAYTFREYIRSPWNAFDFFLVAFSCCASIVTIGATTVMGIDMTGHLGVSMRWLRCVRALRIVRLTTLSPSLLKMLRTMLFAAPSIGNITFGIFIFTSAYAQFGMAFLGTLLYNPDGVGFSRHANFETALRAISTLVRMSTGDSWSALLADAVHNPHVPGVEPPAYA